MSPRLFLVPIVSGLLFAACGDDDTPPPNVTPPQSTTFKLRIENISNMSALPGPISPGLWAVHVGSDLLFTANEKDRGDGLEAVAEDGDPSMLASTIEGRADVAKSGVFTAPEGASQAAPAMPGQAYEVTFDTTMESGKLFLATMLVQSNDLFLAPDGAGIELFDSQGSPFPERDITPFLWLWDAGTEANQAPGAGPDQAPRQSAAGFGAVEGVVAAASRSTRAIPSARRIADVRVAENGSGFDVTVENVSAQHGAIVTPIAPVFWAVHDSSWSLLEEGSVAPNGLEELAEDGSPAGLVAAHGSASGVASAGAQPITMERPNDPAGPAMPGEHYMFSVTPDSAHPILSIAAMVVQSNDAFLSLGPKGVMLLDSTGARRSADDINGDLQRLLSVWDAGTEANEVPGAGENQAPRQMAANTGAPDTNNQVRRYSDATNDLAQAMLDECVEVSVVAGAAPMSFDVTVTNASGGTAFPSPLTPVAWAVHDDNTNLFSVGMPASTGLERLAEDGDAGPLATMLGGAAGVVSSGVQSMPEGGTAPGPVLPGQSYTFSITADAAHRHLSIATMIAQSNDSFLAFGPEGIELLDSSGARRSDMELADSIATALGAWDAGTEANQAGAAGADQAPRQAGPDTGPNEGSSAVRLFDDPVWSYPAVDHLVRVTIGPVQ